MCGRYRLDPQWLADFELDAIRLDKIEVDSSLFSGSREVFPRTWQPIVRLDDDGDALVELRRWGFHRTWPDPHKPDAWIKREFINAVGATIHKLPTFKQAFAERRCLIPMSAWWEWPVMEGVKTRVDISMPKRPVFAAAGLYEISKDNKTGEPVASYTLVTTEPNDFLGTAHDRAPLVLERSDYAAWLAGGVAALALIHAHADPAAFKIEAAHL